MAGYIGSKAVLLSTTAAVVTGDADIGGDLTVDTNTLFVDAANNRVGVGTVSPSTALDVVGTVKATTIRQKNSFAFRAYQSSAQTVSGSTFTKVQFGAEDFDVGGCFDSTTNYRFTPTVAGYYLFTCHINFQASTSMSRNILRITRNGAESGSYGRTVDDSNTGSNFNILSGSDLMYLNGTTDYVEVYGWLQGTGTLTFGSNDANTSVFTGLLVEEA